MKEKKSTNRKPIVVNKYNFGGKWGKTDTWQGGLAGSLGYAVGGISDNLIGGGMTDTTGGKIGSGISNIGGTVGSALSTVNPLLGGIVSAASGLVGGLITRATGADFNEEAIAGIENQNRQMSNTLVASGSNSNIMAQWANQEWGDNFTKSDLGKEGWFSNAVTRKYNKLKREQYAAKNRVLSSYDNAIENTEKQSTLNTLANYSALGGNLYTNGANWDNGIIVIDNGGTHEENPFDGVPMGIDAQGIPNLVEEGEVIFNDYVFSNRLKVPKAVKNKYKLKGDRELTFAEAAKQAQKESEERPNDPISKRGLEDIMIKLQLEQEVIRQNKGNKNSNKFATGGPAGILQQEEDNEGLIGYSKAVGNPFFNDVTNTNLTNTNYSTEDIIYPEEVLITRPGYKDFNTVEGDLRRLGKPGNSTTRTSMPNSTLLRYAPVVGNAIGLAQNLFSKPNYSRADRVLKASEARYTPVGFSPIGNYMSYNPLDVNYMTNKLSAESAATRNAILNSSSPNRTATLLAADYNAQDRLGDLYRKAAESNIAQRQQVENFNRATNMANAEMGIKAAMANQEAALKAANMRLSGTAQAMAMKDAIDAAKNASLSSNMSNLFESLGNIGIDAMNRADRNFFIEKVLPNLSSKAKGGKLNKKRGGFTY